MEKTKYTFASNNSIFVIFETKKVQKESKTKKGFLLLFRLLDGQSCQRKRLKRCTLMLDFSLRETR
jgi:hypothetical protein